MTMGNLFKNLPAHPFAKLNHSLLMTGGAEVTTLARKSQKMFMTAFSTSDLGEAVMKNPAAEAAVNDGPEIGTMKHIGSFEAFLTDPFKGCR
jgi:hypothetical protein